MTDAISSINSAAAVPGPPVPNPSAAPFQAAAAAAQPRQAGAGDLQAIAAELNQHAQETQTDLRFQVDKITGQEVISVIDAQNNQVLLQIPGPQALATAQSLQRLRLQLMDQQA
jgi:uncharacterized FlaG/YvyC family protein